ncbi:amylo-alpha-1,6-glucosidase, partial [mine drainage metagenome]
MLFTGFSGKEVPYAGLPWFSTFFGRDAIITAYSILWARPDIGLNVLRYLEKRQATGVDPFRAAEPGKILHEERSGELSNLGEVPFGQYYGSIDSTPLYIVLACEYYRRTGDEEVLLSLFPSIQKALCWIDQYGLDPDSRFLVYSSGPRGGLVNQGWKDSADSVFHADGKIAVHPIALIEVQGYLYWAWSLLAPLASRLGHVALGNSLTKRARDLKSNVLQKFWVAERNTFAMAIDGVGKPCVISSSN